MKFFKMLTMVTMFFAVTLIMSRQTVAQQVSFQIFYDELSPYGMWVDYPDYGYVWIPNVDRGFGPYASDGYWVFTDDGWTWVSNYRWGWAPFHYGRWDFDNDYGWMWIPDNEWGPAWVSWRSSPGYYGWAPLRPGISINISLGRDYNEPYDRWIFIRDRDITRSDVSNYYVNRTENITIINNSTVIVNTRKDDRRNSTYIAGPDLNDVQKVTDKPIKQVSIRDSNQPGTKLNNDELQIYRPQVEKKNDNEKNLAPAKVIKLNDVKPVKERKTESQQDVNKDINKDKQPQNVNPKVDREKQPENVNPKVIKEKQPENVNPKVTREKQTQNVNPKVIKERQPENVNPKVTREKQTQNVNPKVIKERQQENVAPGKTEELNPKKSRLDQIKKEQKKELDKKEQDNKKKRSY